jgi:hypothetical protein
MCYSVLIVLLVSTGFHSCRSDSFPFFFIFSLPKHFSFLQLVGSVRVVPARVRPSFHFVSKPSAQSAASLEVGSGTLPRSSVQCSSAPVCFRCPSKSCDPDLFSVC